MKTSFASLCATAALIAAAVPVHAQQLEIVSREQITQAIGGKSFDKYITRSNFATITLDKLVFTESIPGKLMLDLVVSFVSDNTEVERMRILFDELIENAQAGESRTLKLSGIQLGRATPLSSVTSINIEVRMVPVAQTQYDSAYKLLYPLLSKAQYGVDLSKVMETFVDIASNGDKAKTLVYRASIPVAQNVIEAQRVERGSGKTSSPLQNNLPFAIELEGSKPVTDASVLGKLQAAANGVSLFVNGKSVSERPTSNFKGFVGLRFTKDRTQALSSSLIQQLKDLSDAAENIFEDANVKQVQSKYADCQRLIDAAVKAKQIDARAEFHLMSYIELARLWAYHKLAVEGGKKGLTESTNWQTVFSNWIDRQKYDGAPHLTQALGISDIYTGTSIAKVFVPYALTDEMTLEVVRRQVSMHKSLAFIGVASYADARTAP